MKRLLIVEDENPFIPEGILEAFGDLDITTTRWGNTAVELFAANRYDAVLLDLRLPILDGFAVLEAIRKIEPSTPVVVLSAYTDSKSRNRALALGANAYYTKPGNFRTIHDKLFELMAKKRFGTIEFDELHTLLLAKHRRLQKLREKQAKMGIDTSPQILIEIEDLQAEIKELQAQIDGVQRN